MRLFFYIFILFSINLGFSQNTETKDFELTWNDFVTLALNSKHQLTIPLVNNHFVDGNNLPVFSSTFNVQKNAILHNYHIKNVKYQIIPSNIAINLQKNLIPNKIKSNFNIRKSGNVSKGILKLTPLIYDGKQIKKIISFTLEYQLSNNNNHNKNSAPIPIYTENSVLSSGTWFKFAIDTTGIFKIDETFLKKLGINTNNLNPKNIRIFGNGGTMLPQLNSVYRYDDLQENAIFIEGEEDGVFDNNDYILFYGKGPDTWKYNPTNLSSSKHQTNIYSDKAFYFITIDKGFGKRISTEDKIDLPAFTQINTFQDFLVHENEKMNLFSNGQQWMGEDFSFNNSQTFHFNFNDIDTAQDVFIRVRGVAISSTNSFMEVNLNGNNLMQLNFQAIPSNSLNLAIPRENISNIKHSQGNIDLTITYKNNGNPSAKAYLDFIEIFGSKKLVAHDKQFSFRNLTTTNANNIYEYQIKNGNNIAQIWDVSDYINPKKIIGEANQSDYTFKSYGNENPKEFIAINNTNFYTPEVLDESKVKNQNLHKLQDIDYLIITQDFLFSEAQRLADYHQKNSNLNTLVVNLNEIYNEFGSGSPDITAIRDFIRFLYLNASSSDKKIKYVTLFGDASFDFKDRINNNNNIVPAFQSYESFNLARSYVTDDYFGMMDDEEGQLLFSDQLDIATGRFPVITSSDAKIAVDKTLSYFNTSSYGDWRNHITVIADDPDKPSEFILQKTVDIIAEDIKINKPGFNIKKIYCDAYLQETSAGGERYPQVNTAIDNAIESGTLVVNYFGHGGIDGWANERILEVDQIKNWKNANTLPLIITVTCEFARFDNPLRSTAGEYAFLNPQGGGANLITTTREIYISLGQIFNKKLSQLLFEFNNENYTISEALLHTKNEFTSDQRFFVYYFGDPALKLAQPKPNIKITKMNGIDINQAKDTLKALSHTTLEGIVTDQTNNLLTNFNGEISTTIYDKTIEKTTLDNDSFGKTMDFTSIESKIFRGRSSVNNGIFSFEFIVPKDIRIAYGKSKLSFYADDKQIDKSGYNLDITIGGIDPNAPEDTTGPNIKLFLNDESFVDGGNTNSSPFLLASLEDKSGINTSITAVDHDIIAIIDNDEANPIILNDYYKTELDDFTKGNVKYQLRNLKPGLHHIKFKCWDTYNNLSESSLDFVVVDNNNLVLSKVLNYPNPFVNYTEFWFNHNKPNESLEVQIQIFTISGKLIKTINQTIQTSGTLSRDISWNGLDDFGNKIGKGVYIYKLKVRSLISNLTAEKVEKLVILQ